MLILEAGDAGRSWLDWEYDFGENGDIVSEITQGPDSPLYRSV